MFTVPPRHGPAGLGFTNDSTKLRAEWLNYTGSILPSALDIMGGGYYLRGNTDLLISSATSEIKFNAPAAIDPISLLGFITIGLTDDAALPVGNGTLTVNSPATFTSTITGTGSVVSVLGGLFGTTDVGGARLRNTAVEHSITGTSYTLTASTGTLIFDASGVPLAQFRIGLPTVATGNPIIFIRGKLLPGSAVVYFCNAADVGSVPTNYYEYWDGGVSTSPITLTLQWSGGRWHVIGKSGAGLTGGAGTFTT